MLARFRSWILDRLFHFFAGVDEPFYTPLNALANFFLRWRKPEKVTHPGELHPDKTFYIIRDTPPHAGLASWHDRVLGYMLRAKRKGWVPVVDPPAPMQKDDGGWYDFFKGPSGIPVSEALQGKNVVVATEQAMIHKRYSKRNIARRHRLIGEIPLSDEAEAFVNARLPKIFSGMPTPAVGVRYRGTDYRPCGTYYPVGHAKVPDIEDFCDALVADLERWGIPAAEGEHLYVMTEEQEALDFLVKRFPKCRYVEKERFCGGKCENTILHMRLPTMTPKENNLMYLLEIYALSKCDYLFGGYNGGVLMAMNLNGGKYRDVHMLKTGVL